MSEEITISVTELHANLHKQLSENVEEYNEMARNNVEEFIHNIYREAERARENQNMEISQMEEGSDGDN